MGQSNLTPSRSLTMMTITAVRACPVGLSAVLFSHFTSSRSLSKEQTIDGVPLTPLITSKALPLRTGSRDKGGARACIRHVRHVSTPPPPPTFCRNEHPPQPTIRELLNNIPTVSDIFAGTTQIERTVVHFLILNKTQPTPHLGTSFCHSFLLPQRPALLFIPSPSRGACGFPNFVSRPPHRKEDQAGRWRVFGRAYFYSAASHSSN
jgi:hypothetical protein